MDYLQYWKFIKECILHITVLNLIINGLPSIPSSKYSTDSLLRIVLNLIINGLPSIPLPKG